MDRKEAEMANSKVSLTEEELLVVQDQCRDCPHWDDAMGCQWPGASDNSPVEDCGVIWSEVK